MKWDDEEVFGLDLSIDGCDEVMYQFSRKDWVAHERHLFAHKWFDYRFMHPVHATFLYAHEYRKAYRDAFARNIDKRASEHILPLKKENVFECEAQVISGIWHGRQFADALGMPYDTFIREAIGNTLRYWQQRHLPRAWQIYSERVCERVAERWDQMQSGALLYGVHPEYQNDRYVGSPPQNAHHEWLMAQAMRRDNPAEPLRRFVNEMNILPIEKIEGRFGIEMTERVRLQ